MKKLLLIDGNSLLFRAYYATAYGRPMTTSKGIPTNAVFGFISMIQKAIDIVKPESVMIAFDAGKHTFRHEIYAEYKGGRKPAPDDLVPQFAIVRDFCSAYPFKWVEMQDIEADDLIGSAAKQAHDYETYILTSDHDMLQLADEHTSILLMKKGITEMDVMTPEKIQETIGVTPLQIIDLKGLMGDTSDNYPGIAGVGEKTAVKLLTTYGSVEGVLEHENEIKGALQKKIIAGHDDAILSKKLATIQTDVKLDFTLEECQYHLQYDTLIPFLHSLDMNSVAKKYEEMKKNETQEEVIPSHTAQLVTNIPPSYLSEESSIFLVENHIDYMHAQLEGLGVSFGNVSFYISYADLKQDTAFLEYLKSEEPHKCGYDIKRAMHLLKRANLDIHFYDDALIMASLADSTLTSEDKIKEHYQVFQSIQYEDVYGKPNKPILLVDTQLQTKYACDYAMDIQKIQKETTKKLEEYQMMDLYRNMELPVTNVLFEMEENGIHCNQQVLDQIAQDVSAQLKQLETGIYEDAGREFNISSPKQLSEVLYDDLALPSGRKRSTAADKLEKLQGIHPIIDKILSYRKLSKIYSTYAEGLKKYIQEDKKIHTIYNQCATQTGRLSSSEPNLQNISVRDEQGKEIRKAFEAEKGCVLMSSDYHQIELRILAHMANEPGLIEAFNSDIDVHTKTAIDIFNVTKEEVTPLMRRRAKAVNFGIVYGISDFGLAEQLGVSRAEAKEFIDVYNEKYPGIMKYMNSLVQFCEENGYVTTISGRRREIPEIHQKNHMVKEFGKRAAMNAPIQGSAAELIKLAMIHIDEEMKKQHVKSKMTLQVHDELIFNVVEDEIDVMKKIIEDGMSQAMKLSVPLTCECSYGKNWYEVK